MTNLRLVFMGTSDFAVPALAALIDAGHEVVCVYSQPPRPAGRGKKTRPGPVHALAEASSIPMRTPASLKDNREQESFAALGADICVVAAYGLILPKAILDAPRLGCLNIHASLLPRWRGAAPIERAILAGDLKTGVTIMRMDQGLDTGAMLLRREVPIDAETNGNDLRDRLAALGAKMIVETLDRLATGTLKPKPQPARGKTYAGKIEKGELRLDWNATSAEVGRVVRAFSPKAWFEFEGERIRVLEASAGGGKSKMSPGTVLDDHLTIACGKGVLCPTRIQRAGKSAMDASAFLRGTSIPEGTLLASPPGKPNRKGSV
ncbi:MAG: methionyl-tRNA formyltransferase [Alphaproteobacteria bacterium]|nr:methionyl-tRNA formyltransferase [Alphaproteobacteria bacterium]